MLDLYCWKICSGQWFGKNGPGKQHFLSIQWPQTGIVPVAIKFLCNCYWSMTLKYILLFLLQALQELWTELRFLPPLRMQQSCLAVPLWWSVWHKASPSPLCHGVDKVTVKNALSRSFRLWFSCLFFFVLFLHCTICITYTAQIHYCNQIIINYSGTSTFYVSTSSLSRFNLISRLLFINFRGWIRHIMIGGESYQVYKRAPPVLIEYSYSVKW